MYQNSPSAEIACKKSTQRYKGADRGPIEPKYGSQNAGKMNIAELSGWSLPTAKIRGIQFASISAVLSAPPYSRKIRVPGTPGKYCRGTAKKKLPTIRLNKKRVNQKNRFLPCHRGDMSSRQPISELEFCLEL